MLFQLPPSFKKYLSVLDGFLDTLPPGARAAFELWHYSSHDAEVFERLSAFGLALCVADSACLSTPVEVTARYGYFRLRDEGYSDADVALWAGGGRRFCRRQPRVKRCSFTSSTKTRARGRHLRSPWSTR